MKKMTAVLIVTVMAIGAKAQVYVQGGVNLANITKTNSGGTDKNNLQEFHYTKRKLVLHLL